MQDTNLDIQDPFFEARNLLNGLIDVLCTHKWLQAEHGKIEQLIHKDGFEVMRLVLQGHLDERAYREPDFDSVHQGPLEHTYKRKNCTRQLNTILGKVTASRRSYSNGGVDSIFPQDAQLNLSADQYSDGLRRQTAFAVSEQSFDKASESIMRNTATTVAKRQVENITRHLSQDFDAFYKSRQGENSDTSDLLILTCDGKGVVMRQIDLRPATQKRQNPASIRSKPGSAGVRNAIVSVWQQWPRFMISRLIVVQPIASLEVKNRILNHPNPVISGAGLRLKNHLARSLNRCLPRPAGAIQTKKENGLCLWMDNQRS